MLRGLFNLPWHAYTGKMQHWGCGSICYFQLCLLVREYLHGVTANSLYLSFFTMQSYKSYYMVSPQTVFTYLFHHAKLQVLQHGVTANSLYLSFHHAKLQVLLHGVTANSIYLSFHHAKLQVLQHGVTANSLYLSFSPCKATTCYYMVSPQTVFTYLFHHAKLQLLTTWCHRKQSLLIFITMQSYKSYNMVSPQTVFTYLFHHAKLQILLHGLTYPCKAWSPQTVTANSLYLSFSPCKATTSYYMVSYLSFSPCKATILLHGITANSLYLSFSPCKATSLTYYMVSPQTVFTYLFHHAKLQLLTTWCHRKQSLLIFFTMQSYKSYSLHGILPQTVFTYLFHHAKLQPCKALTTWCHRKQSLLIFFTMQSYKSYYMVSPQTVFTYPFHHAKLQVLLHGVTANSLYLSFSPCKATSLSTWCHRKQSLLIFITMQSYKSYYMVSPQTVFTYLFSPCKATSLTTWYHRKQSLLIFFTMQSYKSYYMVSPQTVFTYPFHHAKLQVLLHGVTANSLYLSFSPCKATNLTTWCHRKQSLLIFFTIQSYKSYFHPLSLKEIYHKINTVGVYLFFCKKFDRNIPFFSLIWKYFSWTGANFIEVLSR